MIKIKKKMLENLLDHGLEVPEMKILIKDHKVWSHQSGKAVPSRPVVNGRGGHNTHLSEVLSQILEPIALDMTGAEICSTEEALASFERINERIQQDPQWTSFNSLREIWDKSLPTNTESPGAPPDTNGDQPSTSTNKRDTRVEKILPDINSHINISGKVNEKTVENIEPDAKREKKE